ncbi:MAG: hypothetical protein WAJ93_26890 [Candidatus Nitrosopolaris sp.]
MLAGLDIENDICTIDDGVLFNGNCVLYHGNNKLLPLTAISTTSSFLKSYRRDGRFG